MTVNSSANSVILILFVFSDNLSAENSKLSAESGLPGLSLLGSMLSSFLGKDCPHDISVKLALCITWVKLRNQKDNLLWIEIIVSSPVTCKIDQYGFLCLKLYTLPHKPTWKSKIRPTVSHLFISLVDLAVFITASSTFAGLMIKSGSQEKEKCLLDLGAYFLKARVLVVQTPQTVLNFPQKDFWEREKYQNYTVSRAIDGHFPYLCSVTAINCQ